MKRKIRKIRIKVRKEDIARRVAKRFYNAYGFDADTDAAYNRLSTIRVPGG